MNCSLDQNEEEQEEEQEEEDTVVAVAAAIAMESRAISYPQQSFAEKKTMYVYMCEFLGNSTNAPFLMTSLNI